MNNTKTTKRALLSSVMAMLICVAMLIGTTFAWFTDSASTAVNKIQAGTLQVGLEMKDNNGEWVNAEGKTLQFKVDGQIPAEGTQILWEPGCTYELPDLRLVNNGDLWLKVRVYINGIKGDAKLLEAIEFTATYETEDENSQTLTIGTDGTITEFNDQEMLPLSTTGGNYIKIKGHMKESAGNEYQGKSIDGIGITVVATQYTYENDSNDDQYDANAEYPVVVSSQTAFSETVAASENSNIVLSAGTYTLPAAANKTVAISGTKDTVIDMKNKVNNANSISFEGVTVNFGDKDYCGFQHTGKLTYRDCTITGKQFLYGDEVEFNNCVFEQNMVDYNVWTYGAGKVLFKDCTFNCAGKSVLIYNEGSINGQTVEFKNCKFNATEQVAGKAAIEIDSSLLKNGIYKVIIDQATANSVSGFGTGSVSQNSVWNNKKGNKATVIVAGRTVLSAS